MTTARYLTNLDQVTQLNAEERDRLKQVTDKFAFRSNDYYLSLIDWDDPNDPIRRVAIPDTEELQEWGELDASGEASYTVLPGLEHKYPDTALLLLTDVCGSFCRFCFRKRLFLKGNQELVRDISEDIEYIRQHPEISNVLLTGGDPLLLSTRNLADILCQLQEIPHVRIIRIGSKMPAFFPQRIAEDQELLDLMGEISDGEKQLYIMTHFNHPRELNDLAAETLKRVLKTGTKVCSQTPLIRGVNDDPAVLHELFNKLSYLGIPPYYVFQCRPTKGNFTYTLPLEQAYATFVNALKGCSGLARRARFVMSHKSGKMEAVGLTDHFIIFRYHRAADPDEEGRTVVCRRNPDAYWFDDYEEIIELDLAV